MAVVFTPSALLGRGDLDIFLQNSQGNPSNASSITYAIFYVDPLPVEVEVLIGPASRVPVNPAVGEYYGSLMIPSSATPGTYRIRWTFKEQVNSPDQQVVQEFGVVNTGATLGPPIYSPEKTQMIRSLRILLRDHAPDKHYHFRPPEHEGKIGVYNRVFGQIWEDEELCEYLERAIAWWDMFPPATYICSIENLFNMRPQWMTSIYWAAIVHAVFAVSMSWIADEFSLDHGTIVQVHLPDGKTVSLPIGELYDICNDSL